MRSEWVVCDGEDTLFFDSEAEARAAAEKAIRDWRDMCERDGEWPVEVDYVYCAKIVGQSHVSRTEFDDEGHPMLEYEMEWKA